MTKMLSSAHREWYFKALEALNSPAVKGDPANGTVVYNQAISSDESHVRNADPEELAHAVTIALLHSTYGYPLTALAHELHFAHGSKGSKSDEVDALIRDEDGLPYAMIELKAASEYSAGRTAAIRDQLFGTAPLVGSPKLLIYATVEPKGTQPCIKATCIDYSKHKSFKSWQDEAEPSSTHIPREYKDLDYKPFVCQGENDLQFSSTLADFRAVATSFHNEFFGEHPDNTIFENLVKCLLAKIHDERTCKKGEDYGFQVFYKNSKPESAATVFERINGLYKAAYKRYIDPHSDEIDEINPKELSEERVKTVVVALQGMSITKGAAKHGDIIGAFFEEILRSGFKQDRGMYFTHDNIVRFMIEALDLGGLTRVVWQKSNHPENRLPYIIDPACGSGTFLLHAMNVVTRTVKQAEDVLVSDHDSKQFYTARLSDDQPNYWAENFIYGFDPKFIMAITAKVNMVLHGDGSAHIFKDDAFKPLSEYKDVRLRPCADSQRSITKAQYGHELCESFDVVVSNPPFGITLPAETRKTLTDTFCVGEANPSEGLFFERCFQLLKPSGRLGVVVPESFLNAKDMIDVRLFLYRFFHIRAIVSLPRNIFIDTPTLTSLLFAQKKTAHEVREWDKCWLKAAAVAEAKIKSANKVLSKPNLVGKSASKIAMEFMSSLGPLVTEDTWIMKGGKNSALLRFADGAKCKSSEDAAVYYRHILRTAAFSDLKQLWVFQQTAAKLDYKYPAFMVEEIGYKLSKRKEKVRPNEFQVFQARATGSQAEAPTFSLPFLPEAAAIPGTFRGYAGV